jgi:hypothetical protein
MSPTLRLRQRMRVLMHMVIALVIIILLAQLWLFTATLQVMETRGASPEVAIAGLIVSLAACAAVWTLIRFFLRAERSQ